MTIVEQMDQLAQVARRLLPAMMDQSSGLFAHKAVPTVNGPRPQGSNPLYSAISVIGMLADTATASNPAVDSGRSIDTLHYLATQESAPIAVRATTLWSLALAREARFETTLRILEPQFDPGMCSSVELGLVLAALAAASEVLAELPDASRRVAAAAEAELLARFCPRAQLFPASSPRRRPSRPRRLLESKITSFASQVYPIHGLAVYASVSGRDVPRPVALAADRISELQGPLGQWWWLYSTRTGNVLDGYPVYSVHQDAMAFMALAVAQNLGLGSYRAALERGLRWMFGHNELHHSLVDLEKPFIARCIQRSGGDADGRYGMSRGQHTAAMLASWRLREPPGFSPAAAELEVLGECRPYHLGWILYARTLMSGW